ncbi:MAG: hypothetical protein P9X24_15045 [Candidatus Hatepunaea meridiana]|nr:hypothetical protein [Candidatus Hatepunaea meridiana]
MNSSEKALARIRFQNMVYSSDGNTYENIFSKIMGYSYSDFKQIKPQGAIGDRKNDGYRSTVGLYYQVYAPEDSTRRTKQEAVKKAKDDFAGLLEYWNKICPVQGYYFVFNDKFMGSFPEIEKTLVEIKNDHNLITSEVFLAKDLENCLFNLSDDQIISVVGDIPDPQNIQDIDFGILTEIIRYICPNLKPITPESTLLAPDFYEKIQFNGLSRSIDSILCNASYQSGSIDEYFNRNSDFAKQELRDSVNKLYLESLKVKFNIPNEGLTENDHRFFYISNRMLPKNMENKQGKEAQNAIFVIMAYFFESCDIFEDPTGS